MALPNTDESRRQNTILATTLADITPLIMDNAINSHPIVSLFFGKLSQARFGPISMNGRAKRFGTGESIEVRVRLAKSTAFEWMSSGYSPFNKDTQDTARTTRANWKLGGTSIIISGKEKRENAGDAQIADLLNYKTVEAIDATVDGVAAGAFTNAGTTTQITGLDQIISKADAIQGYNGTTHLNWNSRGLQTKGTAPASINFTGGSFATTGVPKWITAWMNASEGAVQPHVTVTTEAVYQYYEGSLAPEIRYKHTDVADGSFQSLQFKGKPVLADSYATSGVTYFLNLDHLWAQVIRGADFQVTSMVEQADQDVFSAKVLFQGNLVTNGRKFQNKVDTQSA